MRAKYYRSLAIARPESPLAGNSIRIVLNRDAPYAASAPYPVTLLEDSPTRATAAVNACLRDERPDVVVFDSSGRLAQYRAAAAAGARVVYVSSRPKTRWKGFRWRRLRLLDQHWIAQPEFLGGRLTQWQRCKLRLAGRPRVLFLDALHEPVDDAGAAALQRDLELVPGKYLLLCPGGGGVFESRVDAAEVFFEAARQLAAGRTEPVLAVLGARLCERVRACAMPANLKILASVPNGTLLGLIRDAEASVVNGGSLLLQCLAVRVPLVAAPIARDQLVRVRRCADRGCVLSASLDAQAIMTAMQTVAAHPGTRQALAEAILNGAAQWDRSGRGGDRGILAPRVRSRTSCRDRFTAAGRLRILQVILSRGFAGSGRAVDEARNALCEHHSVAIAIRRDHRSAGRASIRDLLDSRVQVFELPARWRTRAALGSVMREVAP